MNRLRELRTERGLSQRELGEKVHISPSLIGMIERSQLRPWDKVTRKLARVLKTPAEQIFGGDSVAN